MDAGEAMPCDLYAIRALGPLAYPVATDFGVQVHCRLPCRLSGDSRYHRQHGAEQRYVELISEASTWLSVSRAERQHPTARKMTETTKTHESRARYFENYGRPEKIDI